MSQQPIDEVLGYVEYLDVPEPPKIIAAPQPLHEGRLYRFWRDAWGMDVQHQPHLEIAGIIDRALGDRRFRGEGQTKIAIGLPRGTYKTTGASEATPVEILSVNPDARILLDGFAHRASKARLRAIRRKIEGDAALNDYAGTRKWKPQYREDTWNDSEIIVTTRSDTRSREASIATAGVDRSMNSQHFDVIICDDVVTDTNVLTLERRDKVYNHILDCLPILDPGGVFIIIFTFWHVDDAYMRLKKEDDARVRRGEKPLFTWILHDCYDGPTGLYFPSFIGKDGKTKGHSHAFLEEQRESLGARKFAANYLLKPIADEDKAFNMDALRLRPFQFFTTYERELGGIVKLLDSYEQVDVETTIAWDPMGRKVSRTSDTHGITVVGTDSADDWWLLEAVGIKAPPTVIIDRMCRYILTYRPWTVSIEDTFGSGLWLDMLAEECKRRGIKTTFTEYTTGNVPKNERIVLLQPRWDRRGIVVRTDGEGVPMHPNFIKQVDNFTPVNKDSPDILDSLVQHMRLTRIPEHRVGPIDPNPVDPEYEAFRKRQEEQLVSSGGASAAGRFGPVWTP